VAPDGTLRFAAGGLAVLTPGGEAPAFEQVVPADGGAVICSYVRDISSFLSPRHVRAAKFATDGSLVWGPVAVYDAMSVPIAHWPRLQADGSGGAVLAWHSAAISTFDTRVQRLDGDGNEMWAHNGVLVSTSSGTSQLDPALAFNAATGETFVAWNERNSAQSQWGIYAQKLDAAGTRAWGATGEVLVPVDGINKSYPRAVPYGDGCMVFWADEPGGMFGQDRLLGTRLDGAGAPVWPGAPILVSSVLSTKSRLPLAITGEGTAIILWEDDRDGTPDVYGQNVNEDGTLGPPTVGIEDGQETVEPAVDLPGALVAHACYPNPFNPRTTIAFDLPHAGRVRLAIYDAAGRAVRTLIDGPVAADRHSVTWDGTDDAGRRQPSGVYTYRLEAEGRVLGQRMTLLK